MRALLWLMALWGLAGCRSTPPDCLANVCIGDSVTPAEPPEIPGYELVGGLCGGQTVLSSRSKLVTCDAENADAIIYRDRTHQYGLRLTNGAITSIEKTRLDAYP